MSRSASPAKRRERVAESFRSAAEAIGKIERGMSLFAITRGQWSMIDAILYVLDQVGESEVSVWTWTVAHYEIEVLTRLRMDKRLTGGCLVIDAGARVKNADVIADWKKTFGDESVRYVRNHAKLATVTSRSGYRLLLRGSMNLNFNPRFEQFDLTEGGEDYALVKAIEDDLPVLGDDCSQHDVLGATKLLQSFDSKDLEIFGGLKVWAK